MNRELPDETRVRARFHSALEPLAQPSLPPLLGGAAAGTGRHDRRLRVALSALVAVAVAAGTFAVLRVSVLERGGHPGSHAVTGISASPTPATPACEVPFVEYRPWSDTVPAQTGVGQGQPVAGFLSCSTGTFHPDPSAPAFTRADQDVAYVAELGWVVVPAGDPYAVSPAGNSLAYLDLGATGIGGTLHVISGAGDQAFGEAGADDELLGWADSGVVVAPETVASAARPAAGSGDRLTAFARDGGAVLTGDAYLVDPGSGSVQDLGFSAANAVGASGGVVWTQDSSVALVRHVPGTGTATTWTLPGHAGSGAVESLPGILWQVLGFDGLGRPVVEGGDRVYLLTGPGTATLLTSLTLSGATPSDVSYPDVGGGVVAATVPEVDPIPGGGLMTLLYQSWYGATDPYPVGIWTPISGWHQLASLPAAEMDGTPHFADSWFTP
jgi:hypothetical protein